MFRFIVTIACLLIIDEYTFRFRRRYIERRNLRRWQKRVHVLTPQPAEPTVSPAAAIPLPGFRHWALVCLVGLAVAAACGPAAERGKAVAQIAAIVGGVTFWGVLLAGLFRQRRISNSLRR